MPEPLLTLPPGSPPKRSLIVPLAFAFVAGLIAASLWFFERELRAPIAVQPGGEAGLVAPKTPGNATPESAEPAFSDLLRVGNQQAGPAVLVDMVDVGAPGVWVVIAEMRDGEVWRALGAARAKGPVSDLTVRLLRATTPGMSYSALLYRDDGDGIFELHEDSVYVEFGSGKRVEDQFTAQ